MWGETCDLNSPLWVVIYWKWSILWTPKSVSLCMIQTFSDLMQVCSTFASYYASLKSRITYGNYYALSCLLYCSVDRLQRGQCAMSSCYCVFACCATDGDVNVRRILYSLYVHDELGKKCKTTMAYKMMWTNLKLTTLLMKPSHVALEMQQNLSFCCHHRLS